jgi:hypothetical protein
MVLLSAPLKTEYTIDLGASFEFNAIYFISSIFCLFKTASSSGKWL